MFKRILVPLDESELAEQALPVASRVARVAKSTIELLEVVPPPTEFGPYWGEPPLLVQRAIDTDLTIAADYVAQVAERDTLAGVEVETRTDVGWPAWTILTVAKEDESDLIIMTSHGRTGLSRWFLGSVAEKVIRHAHIPVLLLRDQPLREVFDEKHPLRVLIPLDGSPASEAVLEPALQLIAALSPQAPAVLRLIHVLRPHSSIEKQEQQTLCASDYLETVAQRLQQATTPGPRPIVAWSLPSDEDVADALLRDLEAVVASDEMDQLVPYDLLMMATHGWGGFPPWGLGSVTERVLHGCRLPMLVVRSPERSHVSQDSLT